MFLDILQPIKLLDDARKELSRCSNSVDLQQCVLNVLFDIFEAPMTAFFLGSNAEDLSVVASQGFQANGDMDLGLKAAQQVLVYLSPVLISETMEHPPSPDARQNIRSVMSAGVCWGKETLGVINVQSEKPGAFDENHLALLNLLCGFIAAAMQLLQKRDDHRAEAIELKSRSARYEIIHRVGKQIVEADTVEASMEEVVDLLANQLSYGRAAVLILDPELDELEVVASEGYGDVIGLHIPLSQGATGYAVHHRETVCISDMTTDPRCIKGAGCGRSELVTPIFRKGGVCGVLDVENQAINAFGQEDISVMQVVASYAAIAIGGASSERDFASEREAKEQAELRARLCSESSRALMPIKDPQHLFEESLRLLEKVFGWPYSTLWLLEPEGGQLIVSHSHNSLSVEVGTRISVGDGIPGKAARFSEPTLRGRRRGEGESDATVSRSEMAVPLSREGELFAVLHVEREDASFSRSDLGIFSSFADQMMVALDSVDKNNDLESQLQALDDRTRKLDLLTRVTRSLTRKMSVDQLLEELLRLCAEAFELSNCALLLLDKDRSTLSIKASIGYSENAPRILSVGEGITGQVAASGVPILVNDVTKDSRYVTGLRDGRAEMAAPLRVFDEVIGVLDAESSDEGAFDEEDIDLFTSFAAQAAVVIHSMGIHTSPEISK